AEAAVRRLGERGLSPGVAAFAVEVWRYALGMLADSSEPPTLTNSLREATLSEPTVAPDDSVDSTEPPDDPLPSETSIPPTSAPSLATEVPGSEADDAGPVPDPAVAAAVPPAGVPPPPPAAGKAGTARRWWWAAAAGALVVAVVLAAA